MYGGGYLLPEMLRELSNAIVAKGELQATVNTMRQNLQHDYVDRLIAAVKGTTKQPAAQSVAYYELRRVEKIFSDSQGLAPEANQPHIAHVLFKIRRGLEDK